MLWWIGADKKPFAKLISTSTLFHAREILCAAQKLFHVPVTAHSGRSHLKITKINVAADNETPR